MDDQFVMVSTLQGKIKLGFQEAARIAGTVENDNSATGAMSLMAWTAMLDDSPLGLKPVRVIRRFLRDVETVGLGETIKIYAGHFEEFFSSLRRDRDTGVITGSWSKAYNRLPIAAELISILTTPSEYSHPTVKFVTSFLLACKKVSFRNPTLADEALTRWMRGELRIRTENRDTELIRKMRAVLHAVLPKPDAKFLAGKLGSGSSAEKSTRDVLEKLSRPPQARALSRAIGGWLNLSGEADRQFKQFMADIGYDPLTANATYSDSRWKAIDKDLSKNRTISMEAVWTMFAQQHWMYWLVRAIDESPLGPFIKISDQSRNQRAAISGSIDGELDTLDLSDASDSVAWDLVLDVFPREWSYVFRLTRSATVETPKGRVGVHKFAPMGSALCFPVQCLIYAAVVLVAYIEQDARTRGIAGPENPYAQSIWEKDNILSFIKTEIPSYFTEGVISGSYTTFSIYGDDIICDQLVSSAVMDGLESIGFTVNQSKSFRANNPFRESCGVFAFDGWDVTPLRLSIPFLGHGSIGAEEMARLIALVNRCGDLGFRNTQSQLLHLVMGYHPPDGEKVNPILFSSDRDASFAIYTNSPSNSHLRRRYYDRHAKVKAEPVPVERDYATYEEYRKALRVWESKLTTPYCSDEVKCWRLGPEEVKIPGDVCELQRSDLYRYHLWHRQCWIDAEAAIEVQDEEPTKSRITRGLRVRWGWEPLSR